MQRLDSWLLSQFERFCHWTQRSFGITSVTWLRICLIVVAGFAIQWSGAQRWVELGVVVLWFGTSFLRVHRAETMNSNKRFWGYRVTALFLAISFLPFDILVAREFSYEFMVIAIYFDSCDDLPYSPSRLRKLWASPTTRLEPVNEPS